MLIVDRLGNSPTGNLKIMRVNLGTNKSALKPDTSDSRRADSHIRIEYQIILPAVIAQNLREKFDGLLRRMVAFFFLGDEPGAATKYC